RIVGTGFRRFAPTFAQCPMFSRWGGTAKSQVIVLVSESLRTIFRHAATRRPDFRKKPENSPKKIAKSRVSSISPSRKAAANSLQCRTGVFIDGTEFCWLLLAP
ncbi:MAG TPA: hypothetical protein VKJ77_02115, partial [Caballeronia sp.]|nr:hypothetical protein [Caballeronia sp.]